MVRKRTRSTGAGLSACFCPPRDSVDELPGSTLQFPASANPCEAEVRAPIAEGVQWVVSPGFYPRSSCSARLESEQANGISLSLSISLSTSFSVSLYLQVFGKLEWKDKRNGWSCGTMAWVVVGCSLKSLAAVLRVLFASAKVVETGWSVWVLISPTGDQHEVPGSWLWPCLVLVGEALWVDSLSLFSAIPSNK